MNKKIAFIIGSFFPAQCGGPSNTIFMLAKALAKGGREVEVFTTTFGIRNKQVPIDSPTSLEGFKSTYFSYFKEKWINPKLIFSFFKACKNNEISIAHFSAVFFPLNFFCIWICILFNVPFTVAPRGELSSSALQFSSKKKEWYLKLVTHFFFKKANRIIVTSEDERKDVTNKFPAVEAKIQILPNYYDIEEKDGGVLPLKAKATITFLFLGRLHPIKNLEVLCKSFASFSADKQAVKLVIAGDGDFSYRHSLQKYASEKIEFIGHVEGNQKTAVLQSSYCLILPSKSENFGNVVLEGLAQGIPVIASKGTPWEILEEFNAGMWVEASDDNLKDALERVYSLSAEEYASMSHNAHKLAFDKFSIANNLEHIERVLTVNE